MKLTMNSAIKELNGIVVMGANGQEIDLTGMTYLEFAVMTEELTKEELQPIVNAIIERVGQCGLDAILETMEELVEVGLDKEVLDEEVDLPKDNTKPIVLDPIRMVDMDDFYSLDPEKVVKGIDSVSEICGRYIALVNSGMTNEQAYEVATYGLAKEHEMTMIEKQIELKKLELDTQVRMSGVQRILGK